MSNTITGTNLNINVGKNYKGKLNIFGETKQETSTRGINYCPDINEWTLSNGAYIENGYIVLPSANARANSPYIPIDKQQYFWYFYAKAYTETEGNTPLINIHYYDNSKTLVSGNGNAPAIGTVSTDNDCKWKFGGDSGTTWGQALYNAKYISVAFSYNTQYVTEPYKIKMPMVTSEYQDEFVVYTPNKPSPDYPSEIENVDNVEINVVGKNLLHMALKKGYTLTANGITFTVNNDYSVTINGTATGITFLELNNKDDYYLEVIKGKKYTQSLSNGNNYINLVTQFKEEDNTTFLFPMSKISLQAQTAQYSGKTKSYIKVASGATINNLTVYPMLVEGEFTEETIGAYEPYKSQTEYFPLAEGQKLYEGSYLADDGVHNKRKQYVITGQEDWALWALNGTNVERFFLRDVMTTSQSTTTLCSHFKFMNANQDEEHIRWSTHGGYFSDFLMFINKSKASTVDELKTYLQEQYSNGTPIIVEYELAEEEIIPYTEEQQEAWERLQNIYLFDGVNNIFSNGSKIEPKLELTYLKIVEDDIDFYISESGYLIIPEYNIKYLIDFNASNIPSMPEATEATVRIIGKDGDVVLNTTYEPISFSIVCYTDDNLTLEEKVTEEQKINRFIDLIKNETKTFAIEKDSKYYDVKYSGILTTIRFPAHVQFTIPFKSSEAYAMDLIKKNITGNNSVNSNTIKDVGAVFTIKGPAQTPKISFNNYEMFYDNVLLENTKLIIDSNKSTITHVNNVTGSKTNAMRYYNHQFPKVKYGENTLVVNSGIDDDSQVKVEWNDLKL